MWSRPMLTSDANNGSRASTRSRAQPQFRQAHSSMSSMPESAPPYRSPSSRCGPPNSGDHRPGPYRQTSRANSCCSCIVREGRRGSCRSLTPRLATPASPRWPHACIQANGRLHAISAKRADSGPRISYRQRGPNMRKRAIASHLSLIVR
jgi:hypothetical protein